MSSTPRDEHQRPDLSCPLGQLEWYANGTLPSAEQAAIEAHLATCAACRAEVSEWASLRQVMRAVSAQTPEPRADLFHQIERRLDHAPVASGASGAPRAPALPIGAVGALAWTQARVLRRMLFWMPLLLAPVVAVLVYLPAPWGRAPDASALLAALIAALGMAVLTSRDADPAREITLATPTSPRLALGVRCGLVFGFDLLINCGLILPFLTLKGVVSPAWFLAQWLAPLCFLSAIALLVSVVVNANTAMLVCVSLWGLRVLSDVPGLLFGGSVPLPWAGWQQLYGAFWQQEALLFVCALVAVVLAFGVLERREQFA